MSHIFISHSSDNRELAQELASFLEARGVRMWIAPRDVRPGMDYSEQLQLAIENCGAFVVLVTEAANKSPYVRAETEMAFSTHKPIFPVRASDIQPAPGLALFLKIRHWTDAFGPAKDENLDRLAGELVALSDLGKTAWSSGSTAPPAPAAADVAPPPQPQMMAAMPATAAPAAPAADPTFEDTPEQQARMRAAVGTNADYYLGRWRTMRERGSNVSWNWAACLANLFWFAWRKMWLPMVGFIAALLVLAVLGTASETMNKVTLLLSIGLSFVTGAFGNHLYRAQTARLVAETRGLDQPAAVNALSRRGGTSVPALVISLAVVGLLTLVLLVAVLIAMQQAVPPNPDDKPDYTELPEYQDQ